MKKFFITLLFLFSSLIFAQSIKEADAVLDQFLRELPSKPKEAIEAFFKTNATFYEDNSENILKFAGNFEKLVEKSGDYSSYEKLKSETLSKNVIRYHYLLYFRKLPLEFDITLYYFNGKWMCYNLSYYSDFGLPKVEKKVEDK